MKCIKAVTSSIILLGIANLAFATSTNVVDCSTKTGSYDYGNATGQEGSACHSANQWQRLGETSTRESSGQEENSATNDGVSWVTSSDGGTTWVDNGELASGGLVKFQFEVNRATTGNHKYDLLKSWVDWNQDGAWGEDESIISEKWYKDLDSQTDTTSQSYWDLTQVDRNWTHQGRYDPNNSEGSYNWDLYKFNSDVTSQTFYSDTIEIPALDALKDIWLRARVVCENSLERLSDGMNLISTGFQDQGEVEDYQLTVARAAKAVPEPSTLFIFALGLMAFCSQRKKA